MSTPSRGPDRHVIIAKQNSATNDYDLVEVIGDGATWTVVDTYPQPDTGMTRIDFEPGLTSDGLRMVLYGESEALPAGGSHYVGRAQITDRFAQATPILGPIAHDVYQPFLTEDCARLYFSAITTTFYLEQPPPP